MAYKGLKLLESWGWQMTDRERRIGISRKHVVLCALCFIALAVLVSVRAEANSETVDGVESPNTTEKTYRLSQPGKDPRMLHLLAGTEYFHSRKLKEAKQAFEKALALDGKLAQAHYFLGLIEYAEGNVEEAKTRFQIAHECLGLLPEAAHSSVDVKQVQIEFPDEYEPRMYSMDGWYVSPKDADTAQQQVHSLEAGSTYRIKLNPKRGSSLTRAGIVAAFVAFSFFLAR